jgi:hypothetical protein
MIKAGIAGAQSRAREDQALYLTGRPNELRRLDDLLLNLELFRPNASFEVGPPKEKSPADHVKHAKHAKKKMGERCAPSWATTSNPNASGSPTPESDSQTYGPAK